MTCPHIDPGPLQWLMNLVFTVGGAAIMFPLARIYERWVQRKVRDESMHRSVDALVEQEHVTRMSGKTRYGGRR